MPILKEIIHPSQWMQKKSGCEDLVGSEDGDGKFLSLFSEDGSMDLDAITWVRYSQISEVRMPVYHMGGRK